ncbi:MAG: PorT family protein [Prevotella sp.]|nr:PorT family protein [Prevotella sp.]
MQFFGYVLRSFIVKEHVFYSKTLLRRTLLAACVAAASLSTAAQERTVQNRPYTDLRPLHFGIVVGANMMDMKMTNVGQQTLTLKDETQMQSLVTVDQTNWDPGFNVGVLAEARINEFFAFRMAPQLYFGTRQLTFRNFTKSAEAGYAVEEKQSLKTVYVAANCDLIFASKRFNNHRPYVMAGLAPVFNLTSKKTDYLQLKGYDVFFEVGMGCDFYLPFFKLRPELKFMLGLTNSLSTEHQKTMLDAELMPYAASVNRIKSKMFVLSFYFE